MKIVKAFPLLAMGTMTLGLVGATVLAPVVNAEEAKSTASQTVSVNIDPSLSFKFNQNPVTADAKGTKTVETTGTITSNLLKGFTVTMSTDRDDDNAMHMENNDQQTIPAVADATAATKGWSAYYNGAARVVPAKNHATQLLKTDAPKNETFNVQYAVKADNSVANGTYKATVVYTVAPNQI